MSDRMAGTFVCGKCEEGVGEAVEQIEKLCDEVETVEYFTYLGDRVNASGGCELAVTARARLGWAKFRECGELMYGRKFTLKMKGKVYRCCVRPVMLYGSETWCLNENEINILRRTERAMVRAMCGVKLMEREKTGVLMQMLGLNETIEQVAKVNGMRWYGHVLRRESDHVLRKALEFEVEGVRKRGRPKLTWKKRMENESRKLGLTEEDAMNRAKWRACINGSVSVRSEVNPATSV